MPSSDKAIVDDACSSLFVDRLLNCKTHKMGFDPTLLPEQKPRFEKIQNYHNSFYKKAIAKTSKIEFKKCYYLPDHTNYSSIMVVSKKFIKKGTTLIEVGGHHFAIDEKYIIPGFNDFSMIYSGKSETMHLLLGPIAYVNHSCIPNSRFKPESDGKILLETISDINSGVEVTVQYSNHYFGEEDISCMCALCTVVRVVVEDLVQRASTPAQTFTEKPEFAEQNYSSTSYAGDDNDDDDDDEDDDEGAKVAQIDVNADDDKLCNKLVIKDDELKPGPSRVPAKPVINYEDMSDSSTSYAGDDDCDNDSDDDSAGDDDDEDNLAKNKRKNKCIKKRTRCLFCNKSFMYKSHLSRHIAIHGERKWKCDICNLNFKRADTMMRHRDTHEKKRHVFTCKHCPKKYLHYESLKQHFKNKHTENPPLFNFQQNFLSQKTLNYHLNVHASITPFECPICKEKFSQPYEKSRHIKKIHPF